MTLFQKIILIFTALIIVNAVLLFKIYRVVHQKSDTYTIVCTTTIIADAVKNIVGNSCNVVTLIGPEIDPHTYKPTEQDIYNISSADLIIYNGLHLEARMGDLFESMQAMCPTFAAASKINTDRLISSEEYSTFYDPHVWFDPMLWSDITHDIMLFLVQNRPECATIYQQNTTQYRKKIHATYKATQKIINMVHPSKRTIITTHDAFSYFARAYHCQVISLQGINTASEAGGFDVDAIVTYITQHHIPTIFAENSMPNKNMVALKQYCALQGHTVQVGQPLCSDSLGQVDQLSGTYTGMLQYNANVIAQGLLGQ